MARSHRPFLPLNALATLGAAAHNGFERYAGVGVFLKPWIGRRATNVLWSVTLPVGFVRALIGNDRDRPLLAFNAGVAIAGHGCALRRLAVVAALGCPARGSTRLRGSRPSSCPTTTLCSGHGCSEASAA